ncbi:3-hydroxyacyl-CoA dehydrogenase NAD-binding domain-containing protein [Mesorhizobium sp. LHD-90]|uniref:3-hydroxyacyl-CoA dehydrogenase NAD-binding domain-containing protein n=1 Tax=Mesorhizobium sp. LHD-90 TaxID=3071414 RepID=UPI0027E12E3D|nr:3-hydroxyacyl-CoA dehydrogenase NAD-binding domain-containing protein [Mesorhizobium sp. LHD-90]MDQ6437547.1 3-hydroxyacyl-CoA dehydrogenase NAD-binding domain-containing protein [Mesorhizobium sp. LHD-90]
MAKIACIGAGLVGRAWAVVFARAGFDVALHDRVADEVTARALPTIARMLEGLHATGMLAEDPATVAGRIRAAASIAEAVDGVAHMQESVREDVAIKREVFSEIAAHAPATARLCSSTSALRGSEFLTHIPAPERAMVAHPVNPPSHIPLVEICGSGLTSGEQIDAAKTFFEEAGMRPIVLNKEIDGFILNRLQYTLVAEALHLVGEGYCSASDIDRVMTDGLALRWASLGPFAVAHLNAAGGFRAFVEQLGPMMRRMGEDARTDYKWTDEMVEAIHAEISARIPVDSIPERQAWRDRRILKTRKLQED